MDIIEIIILGIVQGITEWLPISSSGHLVILQNYFGIEQPLIFDIILHLGSVLVILFVFWKDIFSLIKGVIERDEKSIKLIVMLVLASIPIALVGFFLKTFIESIFNDLKTVGFSLLFTSLILFLSRYPKTKNKTLTYKNTLLIGIAQAIAILPGISRSGSTISLGLMQGVKQEEAAKFSFLLAIPAILGATVLEVRNINQISNISYVLIGFLFSIISGYFSLKFLLKVIKSNRFSYFAFYCLILGLIILSKVFLF